MGRSLGPQAVAQCRALLAGEQEPVANTLAPAASDCAYGSDPRHRLDLYWQGAGGQGARPVVLFVHGGGFVLGDKGGAGEHWPNAHIGRWAARSGWLGAVMNYRLAPGHVWPAGSEDVALAVAWLRANVAAYGGDPERIVLLGTSAGSVHIAGYLRLCPDHAAQVRAAAMLSGIYGFTPLADRDELYYGSQEFYADRMPREAVVETDLPLFLACARFDPQRFQTEWVELMQARLERHGTLPWAHYANWHNHYTLAMHIGTRDTALAGALLSFFAEHT
ncbi:alpha/beta hydrolase [Novosphingobium sp. 2580]|uniref:Alpha/beta hydrolase n=2 Tax=Novosphingobium album (ex Hu et al. 2023) TaxID=2930093 RepID=A0ABT0B6M1_9SPHN|nr:alpha/beta hydrolase [Novosphingobium album (ex Hu et al. 2023)]